MDTVRLLTISETAEITFRKVDDDSNPVGEEVTVSFINTPATTECTGEGEDEVCVEVPAVNKFNQLITYIQNQIAGGKTMKWAVTNACKIELGL